MDRRIVLFRMIRKLVFFRPCLIDQGRFIYKFVTKGTVHYDTVHIGTIQFIKKIQKKA